MITDLQRQQRRTAIGGSDVAAILGIDPYRNAADVYWSKVQDLDIPGNDAMQAGTYFEAGILRWAQERLGALSIPEEPVPHRHYPDIPIRVNLDAIVVADGRPVEAKTAGLFGPLKGEWGEQGTAEVPPHILIQCTTELIVIGHDVCEVVAFLGGRGFGLWSVPRNDDLVDIIETAASEFWRKYVLTETPPEIVIPSAETLKAIRRTPDSVVPVDAEIVDRWRAANEWAKEAKKKEEEAHRAVVAQLGTAEAGELPDGRMVTYLQQSRKGYVVEPTTFRVLRMKKEK